MGSLTRNVDHKQNLCELKKAFEIAKYLRYSNLHIHSDEVSNGQIVRYRRDDQSELEAEENLIEGLATVDSFVDKRLRM